MADNLESRDFNDIFSFSPRMDIYQTLVQIYSIKKRRRTIYKNLFSYESEQFLVRLCAVTFSADIKANIEPSQLANSQN